MNGRSMAFGTAVLVVGVLGLSGCTSSSTLATEPTPATSDRSTSADETLGGPSGSETASQPTTTSASTSAPTEPPTGQPQHARLRVMSFNIEYGGTGVDFASVAKAIHAAHADVVAVNEGYGNIPRLARSLGWPYFDIRTQVVSRFPLLTPPGSDARYPLHRGARTTDGRAVLVEVRPGQVAAVINVHLPSAPYSPFMVQNGASANEIRALERRVRVPALRLPLATARDLIADHIPTFLLGDFNSPSDLDWTKATVGLRDQVRYPLRWPASAAVEASGMVDSYRAVHPNPVRNQGLTWPASRPFVKGYNPGPAGQAADRIDLLFSGGPAEAVKSSVVGESGSEAEIVVTPWPSDHRAVVSQFDVTPAPAPTLVSVRSRLVTRGRPLVVDYAAASADATTLLVVPVTNGGWYSPDAEPVGDAAQGTARIDTHGLRPGAYTMDLLDGSGDRLASEPFWVEAAGATPVLQTSKPTFGRGEAVGLSWTDAPGERNDWLAVFRRGGVPGVASYLGWTYIGARVSGSTLLDDRVHGTTWPLPRGRYTAYLLEDDGYDILARADFSVR